MSHRAPLLHLTILEVSSVLQDENELKKYQYQVENFHSHINEKEPSEIIVDLLKQQ
jgi:processive 1,2-diacylglycerol beta-glucosyltransferase